MNENLGPDLPDDFEDQDHISEEDILERIEDSLSHEERVEIEIPPRDLDLMKQFLTSFQVIGAEEVTYDQLEEIWYRLTKDHSISPEDAHMPGIYPGVLKDFGYLLTDFNTKINISSLPLPIRIEDFARHASGIETREFSPRMWVINDKAIPNLEKLGMDRTEVFNSAVGDKEGVIRRSEVTRFLGWLVGQDFLKYDMPAKLEEFMKKNQYDEVTLSRIASVAIIGVIDKQEDLERRRKAYEHGYPVEPAAAQRYQDVVLAMQGIRQWAEVLVLGEPMQA